MELHDLNTPALLLDGARAARNAGRMAARVGSLGARLRPHVKTHKCAEVARLQMANGAAGITVSTLGEARFFAGRGFDDLTYAVPVEPGKFAAAVDLA